MDINMLLEWLTWFKNWAEPKKLNKIKLPPLCSYSITGRQTFTKANFAHYRVSPCSYCCRFRLLLRKGWGNWNTFHSVMTEVNLNCTCMQECVCWEICTPRSYGKILQLNQSIKALFNSLQNTATLFYKYYCFKYCTFSTEITDLKQQCWWL